MRDDKICASCGRSFSWRKKWERDWDAVRYCSRACRGHGIRPVDRALEAETLRLLAERSAGATICPSEAARNVAEREARVDWRTLMEPARRAARRLMASGRVQITQQGRAVDPDTARGPIRVRLSP